MTGIATFFYKTALLLRFGVFIGIAAAIISTIFAGAEFWGLPVDFFVCGIGVTVLSLVGV